MHDQLFNTQEQWTDLDNPQEFFVGLAAQIGVNIDQFSADYQSDAVQNRVANDLRQAEQLRLNSTPSFIVNGEKMAINQIELLLEQKYSNQ